MFEPNNSNVNVFLSVDDFGVGVVSMNVHLSKVFLGDSKLITEEDDVVFSSPEFGLEIFKVGNDAGQLGINDRDLSPFFKDTVFNFVNLIS